MTTTIGPVTLDNDMIHRDEYAFNPILASAQRTVGGGVYVQEFAAQTAGRMITLEATQTQGWQLKTTVDALHALAATPGATYTLTIGSENYTVRFANELESGPIQMQPVHDLAGTVPDTIYYIGTINLMRM